MVENNSSDAIAIRIADALERLAIASERQAAAWERIAQTGEESLRLESAADDDYDESDEDDD